MWGIAQWKFREWAAFAGFAKRIDCITEKCPCCNALVRKGDAFCSKCGAALHQEEETAEKDNADVVTEDDFVPEEAAEEPVKDQKEDLVEEPGEMTENTTEEETKQEEEPVSEPEE